MKLTADWICGFVEGEGSFVIYIAKGKSPNSYQVRLFFKVAQHEKNVQLLYALKKYFGVGLVKRQKKEPQPYWEFVVSRFEHLYTKIIPFFEKHKMHSSKKFDFFRFRKVALFMSRKEHLTSEGLVKIRAIVLRMNKSIAYPEGELDMQKVEKDEERVRTFLKEKEDP